MRGPRPVEAIVFVVVAAAAGALLARRSRPKPPAPPPPRHVVVDAAPEVEDAFDAGAADAFAGWTVDDDDLVDPPEGKTTDPDELVKLVPMLSRDPDSIARAKEQLGPYTNHANQGNPEISRHAISRAQCKANLKGVILQTPLDREICGHPWEVPIHDGDPTKATACIDVFEYPNHPCVLPFVFSYSILAKRLCALDGKRLCTQEEWNAACENDPKGGPKTKYAYGNELDLAICNTGKQKSEKCNVDTALWKSCPSDTVPAGSHPKCRSRLGVFDQHGNVAEAMTRMEKGVNYVQLKGSAFFYDGAMYADDCRFDPRWHVDPVDESWHTNYHLGFRCCRTIVPLEARSDAGEDAMSEVSTPVAKPAPIESEPETDDRDADLDADATAIDENPYADDDATPAPPSD